MDKHSLFIFVVGFCCAYAAIKITELNVPNSVEYGTIDEIILDCKYEANEETDLELKWYYNGQTVYQWIPDTHKSGVATDHFKPLIDLEYNVSNDTDPVYRALKITNITQHLTGNYSCKVSSYDDEDVKTKQLIIYSAPTSGPYMDLIAEEVVCNASGMFPEPKMNMYISGDNDTRTEIYEVSVINKDDNGSFNVTTTYDVNGLDNVTNPTNFVCELSIPGTDFYQKISLLYYRDDNTSSTEDYSNFNDYYSTEESFGPTKANSVMALSSSASLPTLLLVLLLVISK